MLPCHSLKAKTSISLSTTTVERNAEYRAFFFLDAWSPAKLATISRALVRTQPPTMSRQATIDDATMRIEVRDRP